ncbi:MAG: hypothetical protein ACSHW2_12730, partial [Parasphingopyxis sp.]
MPSNLDQQAVQRLRKAILDLQKRDAAEAKKVADNTQRMNRAMEQASRATSSSTASMKAREAERYSKDIERAQNARANIARDISQKSNELVRAQERVDRSITNEEKKRAEAAKKLQKEQERRLRAIERASSVQPSRAIVRTVRSGSRGQSHDVFISH